MNERTVTEVLRRRGRVVEVRLDDGTYLLLDVDLALGWEVKPGRQFSEEHLARMEEESDLARCKSRAFWLLSGGDYPRKGMREKLLRAGFPAEIVEATLARLQELSLLDDTAFAERYVDRAVQNGLSRRQTLEKLMQKGVDRQTAALCVEQRFSSDETESIRRLLKKKYLGALQKENGTRKVFAALMRRGFSGADIRRVLGEMDEEINESGEEL